MTRQIGLALVLLLLSADGAVASIELGPLELLTVDGVR